MNTQIIVTILTGILAITSVVVSNYFIRKKEDRTKRLQIKMEYISKQIEELYGPLYSLIQQIKNYRSVREVITSHPEKQPQDDHKIISFFREKYVLALNEEIRELIKTKFHLIEGKELPGSFCAYLLHSTQMIAQIQLWKELQLNTTHVQGAPAPPDFEKDVKHTLSLLMNKYDYLLKTLE